MSDWFPRHPEFDEADGDRPAAAWKNCNGFNLADLADKMERRQRYAAVCESPIEIDLAVALDMYVGETFRQADLILVPQFKLLRYRMDFAITKDSAPKLFIECDGRDFHSSPEQLANDERKDKAAIDVGVTLLRFSGSEIFRYPDGCVHRVLDYLVEAGAL